METYRVWEKESKMKAFSKEGLASAKVLSDSAFLYQIDKKTEEKAKTSSWLKEGLQKLTDMRNSCEADIENKGTTKRRGKKSKGTATSELEAYRARLEDIKTLNNRIEVILRCLENEEISCEKVNELRDSFETYLQDLSNDYAKSVWDTVIQISSSTPLEIRQHRRRP